MVGAERSVDWEKREIFRKERKCFIVQKREKVFYCPTFQIKTKKIKCPNQAENFTSGQNTLADEEKKLAGTPQLEAARRGSPWR